MTMKIHINIKESIKSKRGKKRLRGRRERNNEEEIKLQT